MGHSAGVLRVGDRVKVYRNLRGPKGQKTYSLVGRLGRVVAHVTEIILTDVTFVVRPAGREKVRREGRKNVHAFVVGTYRRSAMGINASESLPIRITYNPYKDKMFRDVDDAGRYIVSADACVLNQDGVSASYAYYVR
jgi:hypothetical protein